MKRLFAPLCIAAMTLSAPVMAQQATDYSQVQEQSTDLGKGVFWIVGAGGNSTVAIGTDGIILVDTQFAPLYDKLKAKITSLSDKPIRYVINTHYHGDHTGGNAPFIAAGATLVAHENVGKRMATPPVNVFTNQAAAPSPAGALPTQPYATATHKVSVGGQTAEITHPNFAHTDGDSIVYFREANVLSTGDIFTTNGYPNIDISVGAGIDGIIAAVDFMLSISNDQTKIVPGHGAMTNKAALAEFRAMLATARDRIGKAKAEGKTEQQVVDANLLADLDVKWKAANSAPSMRFPMNVYRSLK